MAATVDLPLPMPPVKPITRGRAMRQTGYHAARPAARSESMSREIEVSSAEFEAFATDPAGWPPAGPKEIAFAGRSNVGKSSLINLLASRRHFARTSSTPGRTRGLVFFRVQPASGPPLRFVDLPGF